MTRSTPDRSVHHDPSRLTAPALFHWLFTDARSAWLWLLVRLYLAYSWISSAIEKFTDPQGAWVGAQAGSAVTKFLQGALKKTTGESPDVQGWYAAFIRDVALPNAQTISYLVVYGELLVGLGLVIGLFTGLAAFFGGLMNLNYMLAGSAGTNPLLFLLAVLLIVAWRVAGWWGLDGLIRVRRGEGEVRRETEVRRT